MNRGHNANMILRHIGKRQIILLQVIRVLLGLPNVLVEVVLQLKLLTIHVKLIVSEVVQLFDHAISKLVSLHVKTALIYTLLALGA